MRILASRDVFGAEIRNGEVVYSSTTFSQAMLGPTLRGGVTFFHKYNHRIYQGLPAHLKKTGYKDPGNQGIVGPFQAALNTNKSVFHYVQSEDPQSLRGFGHFMTALSTNRPRWFDADLYPVGERLFGADYDPDYDSVLLVDVGGGRGHDLKGFREAFPEAPKGRLILQDRGALLDTVPKDFFAEYQIEAQPHDFFTPQPVQGARCYFFHHIIHDWNDDDCVKILTNIAAVMKKGYSKLLLYEIVLPAVGALAEDCFLDVVGLIQASIIYS